MASKATLLPPLIISQLNDLPDWESSAEYGKRSKIEVALRHLDDFKLVSEGEVKNWSVQVYSGEHKDETQSSISRLFPKSDASDDSDEDSESVRKPQEYLLFFQRAHEENGPVFVLSTSKAYKDIRRDCSMQFPRYCSRYLSNLSSRIKQVSSRQVFGHIAETSAALRQSPSETVNQSGLVCHGFTTITDEGLKLQFKENGILICKAFSLEQYADLIEQFISNQNDVPIFKWEMPGLPDGNLIPVNSQMQKALHVKACRWLVGLQSEGWTFSLKFSERKEYSNAMNFRLFCERRRYGYCAQGSIEFYPVELPCGSLLPDLEEFKDFLLLNNPFRVPIDPKSATDTMRELALGPVCDKQVSLEYQTVSGHWYRNYFIDCIDGWVRTDNGDVYFKNGSLWYQIHKDYVSRVRESLQRGISKPGCLLSQGQPGYLHLPWGQQNETSYNRSYINLNAEPPNPPSWFDGNQKLRSKVELFDILHIAEGNEVFIYHVKDGFDNHIRVEATQLVTSAQLIYNTKNVGSTHLDSLITSQYCGRVSQCLDEKGNNRLFQALKTGNLHFVLAFRPKENEDILNSPSLYAQREVIRAQEEIERLGFSFHVSPISRG